MSTTEACPCGPPPTGYASSSAATARQQEASMHPEELWAAQLGQGASLKLAHADAKASDDMVNLTIRTLDKKEHRLAVLHDITVPALKDEVAAVTSIGADSQRLVSGGEEMSLDGRLSDYCSAKCHTIYLVVRFPGISYGAPQGHDVEDVETEPAASISAVEAPPRTNPRIVLRGTVTIPVPERDVHRVVHSLMGSQTTRLGDFVNSMACNQSGHSWSRVRRGQGGAVRPRVQRGRQARRAARLGAQRGVDTRNSVNVSFRGSEWETMRVWPQSIDFQAGFGDELLYDAIEETGADGFRLRYSSGAQLSGGTSAPLSEDDASAAGRDQVLSSLLECDGDGNYDLDESYLSANRTMLAPSSEAGDACLEPSASALESLVYVGSSVADDEDWDLDCYDAHSLGQNELPLGRIAGKRKYSEMCNSPSIPHRSAPRSRSMRSSVASNGARAAQAARLAMPRLGEPTGDAAQENNAESASGEGNACAEGNYEDRDASSSRHASLCSPNISISLGSQPGGASPDSAEAASPLLADEPAASDVVCSQQQEAQSAHFCHLELLPSGGQGEGEGEGEGEALMGAVNAWPCGVAAGGRRHSNVLSRESSAAIAGGEQLDDHVAQGSLHEAARANGDPLAAADVHAIDSQMASLSLPSLATASVGGICGGEGSPRQLIDAAKSGSATYKTHPEPLRAGAASGAEAPLEPGDHHCALNSCNCGGTASVNEHSAPVRKNQCCAVM